MIRINLLPVRQARAQASSKKILVLFVVLMIMELGGLIYFQTLKDGELDAINAANTKDQTRLTKLEKETASVSDLEDRKEKLEVQKRVLDGLVDGQSGPVKMLDELSTILTPLVDPKDKLEAANRQWNPDWDPKRVWIEDFNEAHRVVTIAGIARTNEDIAEFLRRLKGSRHFVQADLNISQEITRTELNGARVMQFTITALAIYGRADVAKLAAGTLGVSKK